MGSAALVDMLLRKETLCLKTAGVHVGVSGSFRVGKRDGINARYCVQIQRADGYEYRHGKGGPTLAPNKERRIPPHGFSYGHPAAVSVKKAK